MKPLEPSRRGFLQAGILATAAAAQSNGADVPAFELEEATIVVLQSAMTAGKQTARSLTEKYLARIAAVDRTGPTLRSVIEINPDALAIADDLDRERKAKGPRGPLHGIPVLIKDNIDTKDNMATTAGSQAMIGAKPPADAFLVTRLREAGAVLLGKTNLSEWANYRSSRSTSGWSGRGGQTRHPYSLERNPSGSSSGSAVAVAANLCSVAIGTETDGSIISPSTACGVVGLKPTVGLVSRSGIIPIAHSQDTAGPMARCVADLAALLGVLAGADVNDSVTADAKHADYLQHLDVNGLKGARLGVLRRYFGNHEAVDRLMMAALKKLGELGALLVDPISLDSVNRLGPSESLVLSYEFKADLNAYLAKLGPGAPVKSLAGLIAFNDKNKSKEMPFFGQETFIRAETRGPLTTKEYTDALERCRQLSRKDGIDAVMDKNNLDALIAPSGGPATVTDLICGTRGMGGCSSPAAVSGYPHITVPMGDVYGLPIGLSFFGRAWSESTLIRLAYSFEQATKHRKAPRFLPHAP